MNQAFLFEDFTTTGDAGFAIACHEQPQQRLEHYGVHAASDTELVAMMLGPGISPEQAVLTAARLLVEAGSLAALLSWTPADYRRMKGVSYNKGLQLAVIAEIGRRMLMSPTPTPLLDRPELVAAHLAPVASGALVEKFWVLCLNRKGRLIKQVEITSGTATATLAPPRDVFRAAIQVSASALICAHNHPSGDPVPSSADINITRALREASRTVQIELLDHVIVGSPTLDPRGVGHFSFREAGLL